MLKDVHSELSAPNMRLEISTPTFHDHSYLSAVITHLRDTRLAKDIKVGHVSRKAAVKRDVIQSAESGQFFPDSAQLKAWAQSLGIQWEDLWSQALPKPAPTR